MLARGRFFYCLFAVSLIPLALSLLGADDDIKERFEQTLKSHPEVARQLDENHPLTKEMLLSKLPGGKIDGAHLSYMPSLIQQLGALVLCGDCRPPDSSA